MDAIEILWVDRQCTSHIQSHAHGHIYMNVEMSRTCLIQSVLLSLCFSLSVALWHECVNTALWQLHYYTVEHIHEGSRFTNST